MGKRFLEDDLPATHDFDSENSSQSESEYFNLMSGKKSLIYRSTEHSDGKQSVKKSKNDRENGVTDGDLVQNRQRVLMLASRGIVHRYRHLLDDLHNLLPHSKKDLDSKLDTKGNLGVLNELSELNNCNNCVFFEVRKHQDLYLWLSKTPNGPSFKFHVQNVHTMDELRLTGNCLKGSRHVLSFDKAFDSSPHYLLMKEVLTQIFAVPKTSRKVKPFIDHVLSFSIMDNKIWFRNYQIVEEDAEKSKEKPISLVEIGPRFVMNPMKIFAGSFGGPTLYENESFVSPNDIRRDMKEEKNASALKRRQDNLANEKKMKEVKILPRDSTMDIFA